METLALSFRLISLGSTLFFGYMLYNANTETRVALSTQLMTVVIGSSVALQITKYI